jgi:GntR family transcriptional regulator/MocR family aminotransferase
MARATGAASDESTWIRLERADGETLRRALERTLRDAIRSGALRTGVALPASRALAAQLGVSRGVVTDVYRQLEAQGFLLVRPRAAPVVAPVARAASKPQEFPPTKPARVAFDLTAATPDVALFPTREWAHAAADALRRIPVARLDYGDPRGSDSLREALADHLGRTRGVIADADQILIVQGAAQAVDLLLRVLRRHEVEAVAVEDPSLDRQNERVVSNGLRLVPWPVDDDGVAVGRPDAGAALLTPAHQFPTGAVLSGERRRELLVWAAGRDALLIEDDYDAEFRYDREPVRALQGLDPKHVAYIGTASKTCAPALRLGWMVVPDGLVDETVHEKRLLDGGSPVLEQLALEQALRSGSYDRHVHRARAIYRRRRDRLVHALERHLPDCTVRGIAAGLHVLVELPHAVSDVQVAARAADAGISVEPVAHYRIERRHARQALVVGYGRLSEEAVDPAVAALARVVAAEIRTGAARSRR